MSIYPDLDKLTLEQAISKWKNAASRQTREETQLYYDELAYHIREVEKTGIQFLLEFTLSQQDLTENNLRLIAAILVLPPIENSVFNDFLLRCIEEGQGLVVAQAIFSLSNQENQFALDTVLSMQSDPNPYIRCSVLHYMNHLYPDSAKILLVKSLKDQSYLVRESAIDELDKVQEVEALSLIEPLIYDEHPDVREAATTAIENLLEVNSERQ